MRIPTLHKPALPSGELRKHRYPSAAETFGALIYLSAYRRARSQRVILFAVLASLTPDGAPAEAQSALAILGQAQQTSTAENRGLPGGLSEQLPTADYGHWQGQQIIIR